MIHCPYCDSDEEVIERMDELTTNRYKNKSYCPTNFFCHGCQDYFKIKSTAQVKKFIKYEETLV